MRILRFPRKSSFYLCNSVTRLISLIWVRYFGILNFHIAQSLVISHFLLSIFVNFYTMLFPFMKRLIANLLEKCEAKQLKALHLLQTFGKIAQFFFRE